MMEALAGERAGNVLTVRGRSFQIDSHPVVLAGAREFVSGYEAAIQRLQAALQVAEATIFYRYIHVFADGAWCTNGPDDRMDFLRRYLLQPKAVPRIASPQYGFVDAVAFSEEMLPANA